MTGLADDLDRAELMVDRDAMGKFTAGSNKNYQTLSGVLPGGIWSTPAYFNGTVYYGNVGATLKAFSIVSAKLVATPQSQSDKKIR